MTKNYSLHNVDIVKYPHHRDRILLKNCLKQILYPERIVCKYLTAKVNKTPFSDIEKTHKINNIK